MTTDIELIKAQLSGPLVAAGVSLCNARRTNDEAAAERAAERMWMLLDCYGEHLFLLDADSEFSALDNLRGILGKLAQLDVHLNEARLTADGRYLLNVRLVVHDCGKGAYCPLFD